MQAHASGDQIVLPLTLEMSFWLWVRENLGQLFSGLGMFNLKLPNRLQPVLRRHLAWFEFLTRAAGAHCYWTPSSPGYQQQHMGKWVFLRGLMREVSDWGKFPDVFRLLVPDADISLLDLPGNGNLHALRSPIRLEQMTEACRSQPKSQAVEQPCHLFALSLGGMVDTDWATRYTEEIDCCVLLNTSFRPASPFYRRLRRRNYPALFALSLCLLGWGRAPSGTPGKSVAAPDQQSQPTANAGPDRLDQLSTRSSGQSRQCARPAVCCNSLSGAGKRTADTAADSWQRRRPADRSTLFAKPGVTNSKRHSRCSKRAGHDLTLDAGPMPGRGWQSRCVIGWCCKRWLQRAHRINVNPRWFWFW